MYVNIGRSALQRFAAVQVVLVEHHFMNGVGRSIVPAGVVVMIEGDGDYRPATDVGAAPSLAAAQELHADAEILVPHLGIALQHSCFVGGEDPIYESDCA